MFVCELYMFVLCVDEMSSRELLNIFRVTIKSTNEFEMRIKMKFIKNTGPITHTAYLMIIIFSSKYRF